MAIWIPMLSFLSSAIAIILASIVGTVISCLRRRRCAVGFFHPYTNDGGGGERVLWCAVRAVQDEKPDLDCIIYTGDDASPETLTARALDRFGVHLLHPPIVLPLERPAGIPILVSVAQFRPEKAHGLQLEAFALAVNRLGPDMTKPKLQFVGSCRNKEDLERLQKLKVRASELDMEKNVEFYKDVKYSELVQLLGSAIAGLHSMIDEHFGISVVEYMAAGAIPIVMVI